MRFATLSPGILSLLLACALSCAAAAVRAADALVGEVQTRWASSPYGPWLARILPPYRTPATLPEPESRGARLMARYCVQCHHLPSPAMHHVEKWPRIVDRMVGRMKGQGNMGKLMLDMMGELAAPTEEEVHTLLAYLARHAQRVLEPARYPDLSTRGRAFKDACSQCHALPEPRSRPAAEWAVVVSRMQRNMEWMNRVVGSRPNPREPQLEVSEILGYLGRYAARP